MCLITPEILQIHAWGVCIYVIRRGDELFLIDSGFWGALASFGRALKSVGWHHCKIAGIILTHGHLDHAFNAHCFSREFGAWVAAPELDKAHVAGEYPYSGSARVCGWLEEVGRNVLGYRPAEDVRWFGADKVFNLLGGLQVVPLPGHTAGHCGFYSAEKRILFCGDLFASFWFSAHLPPDILNSQPDKIPTSLDTAISLDISGVLPAHCDRASSEKHLSRLRRLAAKHA